MSTTLIAALAASVIQYCPWPDRGLDKFMGDVPAAVDTYTDIPKAVREQLKAKMRSRKYDDIAHIRRDGITSDAWEYGPLQMMHFGTGRKICATVDTSMWSAADPGERALIYCVGDHCIAVPTVCRNVSQIARKRSKIPPVTPVPFETPGPNPSPGPEPRLPDDLLKSLTLPPIESEPLLPEVSFAWQIHILPVEKPRDDFERLSAEQSFYELWARPIFGRLVGAVPRSIWTPQPLQPVPGVFPVGPLPDPVPGPVPVADRPGPGLDVPVPAPPVFSTPSRPPIDPPDSSVPVAPVPEPGTVVMFFLGFAWLSRELWQRRRKDRQGFYMYDHRALSREASE
jgi:hypothetical protein